MPKAKVRLDDKQKEALKADYKAGVKGPALAEKYGVSYGTVRNVLGLNTGGGGKRNKDAAKVIAKLALPSDYPTLQEIENALVAKLEEVKAKRVACKAEEIKRLEEEKAALDKKIKEMKKA